VYGITKESIMLPKTITVNGGNNQYSFFETIGGDKVVYHRDDHTDKDTKKLEFIRTEPKRSGVNYGKRRGFVRFTHNTPTLDSDGSANVEPSVSNASINWPVGVSDQTATAHVQDQLGCLFSLLTGENYTDPTVAWNNEPLKGIVDFFVTGDVSISAT